MNRRSHATILFVGLVLLLPMPPASGEDQAAPSSGTLPSHGALSGRVIVHGSPPEEKWLPVQKHRTFCGEKRPLGQYRVSPSGGVENVAVLLEAKGDFRSLPSQQNARVLLDNRDCEFVPRVQVTLPSAMLEVRNSDPILHTAHAFQGNGKTAFHVALPHFRDRTRTQLPRSGLLRIVCDVGHTWMRAYILIASTPLTAVTGPEGTFEIDNIPPGHYRLKAWHEALGSIEREVSISKGKRTSLTLVLGIGNASRE